MFVFLLLVSDLCSLFIHYGLLHSISHMTLNVSLSKSVLATTAGRKKTTQEGISIGLQRKEKTFRTASVSNQEGKIDWVCRNIKHTAMHLENRVLFGGKTAVPKLLCCPSGTVQGGFIDVLENTHVHLTEQVFHR